MDEPVKDTKPIYAEYRPPTERERNRAALLRILFWFGLAAVLFLGALFLELLDG